MILTIEIRNMSTPEIAEAEIYCDAEGLELLTRKIGFLKPGTHAHLMTPSWAGDELTELPQGGKDTILLNHLCISVKPS
jgi:hypothetical protein